jgi:uncharacterized protein (DUF1778 family)
MAKVGRPKKFIHNVHIGMKVLPEQRELIRELARKRGKTISELLLELVEQAGKEEQGNAPIKKITVRELRRFSEEKRKRIVLAQGKIGAKNQEWEEDYEDFYDVE